MCLVKHRHRCVKCMHTMPVWTYAHPSMGTDRCQHWAKPNKALQGPKVPQGCVKSCAVAAVTTQAAHKGKAGARSGPLSCLAASTHANSDSAGHCRALANHNSCCDQCAKTPTDSEAVPQRPMHVVPERVISPSPQAAATTLYLECMRSR